MYCIGTSRWRILRRLHLVGGCAFWKDVRDFRRADSETHDSLVRAGLMMAHTTEDGIVQLTARGRVVQDLGLVTLDEFKRINDPARTPNPKGAT